MIGRGQMGSEFYQKLSYLGKVRDRIITSEAGGTEKRIFIFLVSQNK